MAPWVTEEDIILRTSIVVIRQGAQGGQPVVKVLLEWRDRNCFQVCLVFALGNGLPNSCPGFRPFRLVSVAQSAPE